MNLETAILLSHRALAFALFLMGFEFYLLGRNPSFLKIWTYENLKSELLAGLPLPSKLIETVWSEKSLRVLGLVQILCSVICFFNHSAFVLIILFLIHLVNTIRFRGTYNGGSDMMIIVVLTGLIMTALAPPEYQKMGLIYIAIHALYSYIKSGYSKLIQPEWRNGSALAAFLERSQLTPIRTTATWLKTNGSPYRIVFMILCWSVIIFEILIIGVPFFSNVLKFYFVGAVIFHFVVYVLFGLNRFFWAWLSAWPAIFFSLGQQLFN